MLLTSDAVDKVIHGNDVESLVEELHNAVGGDIAAAARHEDGLAGTRHEDVLGLRIQRKCLKLSNTSCSTAGKKSPVLLYV